MSTPQDHDDARLAGTVETMRWLHATAQAQPDAAFVDQLERQLMPPLETTRSHAPKSRPAVDELPQPGVRLERPPAPRRTNAGWMYRFASFALVLALIGGTVFALTRFRNGGEETPSTYTAVGAGNLETPTPTVIEEPSTSGEWRVSTAASEAITTTEYGGTDAMVVIDGILIRAWMNQNTAGLEALSTSNGEVLWTNDTPWISGPTNLPGAISNLAFQSDASNIYVVTDLPQTAPGQVLQYELIAIDIRTGENRWSRTFEDGIASFGAGTAGLYVQSQGGDVLKVDPATGDIVWTLEGDPLVTGAIAPYSGSDAVIVIGNEGVVQSIDPQTGELIWQTDTDLHSFHLSIAEGTLDSGQRIVVVRAPEWLQEEFEGQRFDETKSTLMALDFETGDVLWSRTLNDPDKGQMQIADGMIYATTSLVKYAVNNEAGERIDTLFRNWLVGIDLETGDEIWSIESDPSWGMAFELNGDTLIMYRFYGAFITVDVSAHAVTCDAFNPTGATSDEDDLRVHAGAYDGEMLYLSLANGEVMAIDPGDWTC